MFQSRKHWLRKYLKKKSKVFKGLSKNSFLNWKYLIKTLAKSLEKTARKWNALSVLEMHYKQKFKVYKFNL